MYDYFLYGAVAALACVLVGMCLRRRYLRVLTIESLEYARADFESGNIPPTADFLHGASRRADRLTQRARLLSLRIKDHSGVEYIPLDGVHDAIVRFIYSARRGERYRDCAVHVQAIHSYVLTVMGDRDTPDDLRRDLSDWQRHFARWRRVTYHIFRRVVLESA